MRSGFSRTFLTFLLSFVFLTGVLAKPLQALTIEDEQKMGQEFLKAALRHLRLIEDPEVIEYYNRIGQRVVEHLEVHTFPYHFYVVDSSALNAFAAPAGYVFMNRGLIQIMENEGELAAILAHEIAHVQSRHLAERMARSRKLNLVSLGGLLASVFLGGSSEASQAIVAGTLASTTSLELSYSRQNEEEADRKGLRYMEAAGYQPEAIVSIMSKMGKKNYWTGSSFPTYLSTHPGVPERVGYLAATLETRPESSRQSGIGAGDVQGFNLMQAKLLGGYEDTSEAENSLRTWLEHPEKRALAYYGLGLVERRQGKMEEAVTALKTAVSLRPDLAPCLVELGETYFQMGKVDKAVSVLESALTLDQDQPVTLYLLGRCLLEQGNAAEAYRHLARAANLNDRLYGIHYHLGLAYGQLGQLDEAHYRFGRHHQRQGSWRKAQFHFEEALRRSNDPARREVIQQALKEVQLETRAAQKEEQSRRGH